MIKSLLMSLKGVISMKYNYPIKYAVMPIYEQVGWCNGLNDLERKYEIVYNIVSKCYVMKMKLLIIFATGKSEKRYDVVFPYIKSGSMKSGTEFFRHIMKISKIAT